ncbi:phage tail tape measure protein [uncultured Piscinibacter sp.]|uniref:phage tail tape measure protein n=1 Tax=uncultured Piscinibacter sp. TaxID=1131835 RepID=UPI0026347BF5|nr:phage tail tape measure protein [uncultured Piscinibacter sp.]
MASNDDIRIGVGVDYDGAGLKAAESDIRKLNTGVSSIAQGTGGATSGLAGVGAATASAGAGLAKVAASATEVNTALQAAGETGAETSAGLLDIASAADDAAKGLAGVGDAGAEAGAGVDGARGKTSALNDVLGLFGKRVQENASDTKVFGVNAGDLAGKLGLAGEGATGAGGALGGMLSKVTALNPATLAMAAGVGLAATALLGVGAAAVSAAEGFEATFRQVATLGADFGKPIEQVQADVSSLATTLGVDGVDAANALYDAVSSGVPPENSIAFLEAAGKAAVAGAANLSDVGSAMTVVMNSWGDAAGGATDITDKLFAAVNVGVTTMPELAANMGNVAGIAAAANVTFDETSAALAQITTKGKTTSVASTQLKGIISELMTPTSRSALVLNELGYASGAAAVEALGLQGTLNALEAEASKNGQAINTMFGSVEAGAAALDLTGANAQGFTEKLAAVADSSGSTERALAEVNEGFSRQKQLLAGELSGMLRDLGLALLPALTAGAKALHPVLTGMHAGLNGLLGVVSQAGPLLGDMASGVGSIISIAGAAVAGLWDLVNAGAQLVDGWQNVAIIAGTVGGTFAALAAPVTLVVGAVAGLTLGIGALRRETAEHQELLGPLNLSMQQYGEAVDNGAKKSGLLAGLVASARDALEPATASVTRNAEAYLKHNAGVSDAVLASDSMKEALNRLNRQYHDGKITIDQYQLGLLEAADTASRAAGEGHVLTAAQQEQADGFAKVLAQTAAYAGGIDLAAQQAAPFQEQLAGISAEFAKGNITAEEAKRRITEYATSLSTASQAMAGGGPEDQAAAVMSNYAEEFGANTALILKAGDGLLLGEQERAEKLVEINDNLHQGVSQSLQQLWDTRKSFEEKFAEARAQDAQAQAAARQQVQQGEAEHNAKMAELQAKAAQGGEAGAKAQAAIAEEQKRWSGILAVASGGVQANTAKVQEQYDTERATIRESLAQTVIDHLNAMVMMGDVSAETARGIYGALSEAYPGVEAINPVTEATLNFSAAVGEAMQGGDPSAIVTAINTVEQTMVDADNKNRESLGIAQQTWEGIGDQAASGSAAVVAATGAAADETTSRSEQMTAAHLETARSHAQLAEDAEASGQKQVKAAGAAASGTSDKLGQVRGELSATAGAARNVGTEVDRSLSGMGDKAASGVQGVGRALDDVKGKMAETAQEANRMSAGQVEALIAGQDAGRDAASAIDDSMQDVGSSMDHVAERTDEAATALDNLPDEVKVEVSVPGAEESIRTIGRLLADLQKLKSVSIAVTTRHNPQDRATSEGGSFAMEHWLYDLYAAADSGDVAVNSQVSDQSNGLLTDTDSDGGLSWKTALDELTAKDYVVTISAEIDMSEYERIKAQFDSDIADTQARLNEVTALADYWAQQLSGSWQAVIAQLRLINQDELPAFIAGLALPEGIDTLEELIAHFQSLKPDEQMDLWKRMFDDMKAAEAGRHDAWMTDRKKEDEEDESLIQARIRRIEELRQKEEEKAKKSGNQAKEIALDPEIDAATLATKDLLDALGFVGSTALEDFYEAFTLGARDGIKSSEELAEALKYLQEETKRLSSEAAELERARHEEAVAALEQIGNMTARQFDNWKTHNAEQIRANKELADLVAKRTAELEKARIAAEKALEKELKDQAKSRESDEKAAHKLILDHLAEQKDAEKDRHDARLDALDELKDAEDDRHDAALRDIEERGKRERENLGLLEDQLSDMKLRAQAVELAQGGLDEAKRVLADLQKAISRLPKDDKRTRPGDVDSMTAAGIGLSKDSIAAALATDKLSASARRRLLLLQGGASLGLSQLRELLVEMEAALEHTADTRVDEVDAIKKQIGQQEYLIALEKRRLEGVEKRLKSEVDGENARHELEMDNLSMRREAEQDAWDAYQRRVDQAKRAEDERHAGKLRQIENELRATLLAQGLVENLGEDPEVAFQRAKAIADIYTQILDRLIGSSGPPAGGSLLDRPGLRVGTGGQGGAGLRVSTGQPSPALDGRIVTAGELFATGATALVAAITSPTGRAFTAGLNLFADAVDKAAGPKKKPAPHGADDEAFWGDNKYGDIRHHFGARQRYLRRQAEEAARDMLVGSDTSFTRESLGGGALGAGLTGGMPIGGNVRRDPGGGPLEPFLAGMRQLAVEAPKVGATVDDHFFSPLDAGMVRLIGNAEMLRDTLSDIAAITGGVGAGGGPVTIDRGVTFNGPVYIDRDLAAEIGLLDAARIVI